MIHLMLVDDHAILRHGLKRSLQDCDDIRVVGETTTGENLLKSVTACRPQVVVLDIDLADASRHTLIGQIKKSVPDCGVVVLTMYSHVRYALDSLRNGADGFVLKSSSFGELLEAIRTVARGKTYVCSEQSSELIGWIKSPKKSALENLSKREFEVLTRVGKGLSLRAAGAQMGLSDKTVSTYQTRLMEKLNLSNKTDLVKFALQSGLIS
jgi:DNA-binding NarL/FixJ family response regulator